MRIYAVTKGCYSDYHICALTVSEEKAERLKKLFTDRHDEASIEVFEDGERSELRVLYYCFLDGREPRIEEYPDGDEEERVFVDNDGEVGSIRVYAEDAAHAQKKAYDMVTEYKAKKANIW